MSRRKQLPCQNCGCKDFWIDTHRDEKANLYFAYVRCYNCWEVNSITVSKTSEQNAIKLIDKDFNIIQ